MNWPHIHLMLNHIPLLVIPTALVFLIHALITGATASSRLAYAVVALASLTVLPIEHSGEEAEEVIERMPLVSRAQIKEHEEAAETAVPVVLALGAAAVAALVLDLKGRWQKLAAGTVIALGFVALGLLGWAANEGGHIRHPEIRDADPTAAHDEAGHMPYSNEGSSVDRGD